MDKTASTSVHLKFDSLGGRILNAVNIVLLIAISLICLFPFLHIAATSLSSARAIMSGEVTFLPVDVHLSSYIAVIENSSMVHSFGFSVVLVLLNTVVCMFMTTCAAYAMTKKDLPGQRFFMLMIVFTMYFNAGIIPNFLIVKGVGLLDTIWALVLPGAISAYNMIIMRTSFMSLSPSLIEAAHIDGCSELGILARIVIPLSMPVLATISLFYAVGRWNGFSDALYYINDQKMYPLQLRLREIITTNRMAEMNTMEDSMANLMPENIKAASIMFATLPILIPYPFLQRYFISGVMIGSVKE